MDSAKRIVDGEGLAEGVPVGSVEGDGSVVPSVGTTDPGSVP